MIRIFRWGTKDSWEGGIRSRYFMCIGEEEPVALVYHPRQLFNGKDSSKFRLSVRKTNSDEVNLSFVHHFKEVLDIKNEGQPLIEFLEYMTKFLSESTDPIRCSFNESSWDD